MEISFEKYNEKKKKNTESKDIRIFEYYSNTHTNIRMSILVFVAILSLDVKDDVNVNS